MKKLVLATVLAIPGAAFAASAGNLDLYYVPSASIDVSVPGFGSGDDDGDGFGIKGRGRVSDAFSLHAEYQSTDYDDSNTEIDQLRFGGGFDLTPNLMAMVEYADFDIDGEGTDGFGLHGRFETGMSESLSLFGQLGYLMLQDDSEDVTGVEFSLGAALQLAPTWSVWADYRSTSLEGDDSNVEVELDDIRLGVRFGF